MRSLVILPTYNERENLERLVRAVLSQSDDIDVLIVDDNSPDGTGRIARWLSANSPRVRSMHRPEKQGLGTAYLQGFREALSCGYHHIIQMDADFSHNPTDLARLIAPVRDGEADLTIGSRYTAGGGTRHWPLRRRLLSRAGSLYARTVLDVPVRDLTGGFRCFHRRVLNSLDLDAMRTVGYGFLIELLFRTLQAGFRVQEVPIIFTERQLGASKMSGAIVREALTLCWRLRLEPSPAARPLEHADVQEREVGA